MHGAGGGDLQPQLKGRGGEVRRNRLESEAEVDRSAGWCGGLWDRTWAGMSLPMTLESLPLGKLTCTHGPKQAVRALGRGAVKQAEALTVSSHSEFQVVLCHCFLNPSSGPLSFLSSGQAVRGLWFPCCF